MMVPPAPVRGRFERAFALLACLVAFAPAANAQTPTQPQLYWSQNIYDAPIDRYSLHRSNLDGSQAVELNRAVIPEPYLGMAIHDGKIIWGSDDNSIYAATLAGEELGRWEGALPPAVRATVLGMAYDDVTGATFRTTFTPQGDRDIERVDAGGNATVVVPTELFSMLALALDPVNRKIYFGGNTDGQGVIRRANLDGTQVETVIGDLSLDGGLFDLALDPLGGRIYWTARDLSGGRIDRASLDGTGIETVVTGFPRGVLALSVPIPEPAGAIVSALSSLLALRLRPPRLLTSHPRASTGCP